MFHLNAGKLFHRHWLILWRWLIMVLLLCVTIRHELLSCIKLYVYWLLFSVWFSSEREVPFGMSWPRGFQFSTSYLRVEFHWNFVIDDIAGGCLGFSFLFASFLFLLNNYGLADTRVVTIVFTSWAITIYIVSLSGGFSTIIIRIVKHEYLFWCVMFLFFVDFLWYLSTLCAVLCRCRYV